MDIPRAWEQALQQDLRGVLMVIGAPDAGKSTFAQYLFRRLCLNGLRTAYLDGDPGQSRLGPPTTITTALNPENQTGFPPTGQWRRWFVGATSPRGHMLSLVVGTARLAEAARGMGAVCVVHDTCGLVDPSSGGLALKLAKIDLLRPAVVFAIQADGELAPLLAPLRRSRRVRLVELPASPARRPRDMSDRQAYRRDRFASYFAPARLLEIDWTRRAVLPRPFFQPHQLVALEDRRGFTRGLGLVHSFDIPARQVTLLTPLDSLSGIETLHLGDLLVDPQTFRDSPLHFPPMDSSRPSLRPNTSGK